MTDTKKLIAEARALDAAATPGPWGDDDGNVFCRPLAAARHEACVAKVEGRPYEADHLAFDAFVCTTEQRHPESDADAAFIARARTLMMELAVALEASERERDAATERVDVLTRALGIEREEGAKARERLACADHFEVGDVTIYVDAGVWRVYRDSRTKPLEWLSVDGAWSGDWRSEASFSSSDAAFEALARATEKECGR